MPTARKHSPSTWNADSREDFLDIAGHELRAPITALKGHVQLLQRRLRKQEGRESDLADLGKMMFQIERINHQLDMYVGASHIFRDTYAVIPADTDLVTLVRHVVSIYNAGIIGYTIELQSEIDQIPGKWDRKRIEEAVSALLANAVKFSSGGEITVRLSSADGSARVEISDRGVGVPAGERHSIFDPYTHGSNVENAGTGLGLHVAREAVRRHGGRIGVRARPGGGSVFWFTLPLVPPTSTAAPKHIRPPKTATMSD